MDKLFTETIELIKRIYKKYPGGGALHIVLDDGNDDDRCILWCLQNSIPDKNFCKVEDRKMFEQCAINLLKLGAKRKRGNCIYQAFADMRKEDEGK
jgi:hypothetical protein